MMECVGVTDRYGGTNSLANERDPMEKNIYVYILYMYMGNTHAHIIIILTTRTFLTWFFLKYSIIYYIIYSNEWNPHTTTTLYFIFFLIYATLLISSCFVCVCGGEISFGWFSFGPGMGVVDSKTKQKRVSSMES